jgi:hypothetical protein
METHQTIQNIKERKTYHSPELVAYGSIEDLTLEGNTGDPDALGGGSIQTLAPPNYLP